MRLSISALVLGTLAAGSVSAASISHEHFHGKRHNHAVRHAEMMKRTAEVVEVEKRDNFVGNLLNAAGSSKLAAIGAMAGLNKVASDSSLTPWLGTAGNAPWTNEFINNSGEDLVLALWGPTGSWINAVQPQVTVSIPKNGSQVVSFPNGWSGAWAPIYGATTMYYGQVIETWGEGTFNTQYSTVDVSREVNMNGRPMKIVTPKCVSDMNTCVFKCSNPNQSQCLTGYKLENCANGSQEGATFGQSYGADSGGCSNMGSSAALKTYLG